MSATHSGDMIPDPAPAVLALGQNASGGGALSGDLAAAPTHSPEATNRSLFVRLTVMMLLEFAVFGSWFATFGLVLATHGLPTIIGTAYSLAAVAAIVAPMCLGAIADRYLASQKALAVAHISGGIVMLLLPGVVAAANGSLALLLIFGYMLFFQPTLGLANTVAFRHLTGQQHLFPYVRVFGTVGWVIAGLLVGWLGLSASTNLFYVTAVTSFVFGAYAFTLPSTPPPARGARFSLGDVVGSRAWVLLRERNFAVLMVCGLLTSISLGIYNTFSATYLGALGIDNVAGLLALGQATEVVCIVLIPIALRTLGMKWSLFAGMVMWGLRFILFIVAAGSGTWAAVLAIALQGICNDFFIVLAAMYIDRVVPVDLLAQAQSMLILVVSGLGALVGSYVAGQIFGGTIVTHPEAGAGAWTPMWLVPIGTAAVTAVLWAVLFRGSRAHDDVRHGAVVTAH